MHADLIAQVLSIAEGGTEWGNFVNLPELITLLARFWLVHLARLGRSGKPSPGERRWRPKVSWPGIPGDDGVRGFLPLCLGLRPGTPVSAEMAQLVQIVCHEAWLEDAADMVLAPSLLMAHSPEG